MPYFYKNDRRVETIAAVCHDANRAYCQEVGDFSQVPWNDAQEWQRASAIDGVNFHLNNPSAGPSASHENWRREKIRTGWKYGPVKDASKKEHPCMVDYDELPVEQKLKDYIFCNIIKAFIQAEGGDAGYRNRTKLLVVEDQYKKAELIREGYFSDCNIIALGDSLVGKGYRRIIVMLSKGSDLDDELLQIYIGNLRTKLIGNDSKLIIL